MSVLAAARIAKMLSSKNTPKVGPSAPTVPQRNMMSSVNQPQPHDQAYDHMRRHIVRNEESNVNRVTRGQSPPPTPVAVVHATQKFRKKRVSLIEG